MSTNFWQKLPKPFTVLAPMDDVTDTVFRQVVLSAGRPDVFFTEFTSADGLVFNSHGVPLRKLMFTKGQHPIVAQIWGKDPDRMEKAAKIVADLGFDGIDINMGCPVRDVIRLGAGAGLIGNYESAGNVISAVKKGAGGLPVSVKTRLGINTNIAADWSTFLLKQNLAALTIHARTAKQMSAVPAQWEEVGKIVKIRDRIAPNTPIIGNGDVKSYREILKLSQEYGVDGVMVGRGIFTDPWIFDSSSILASHPRQEYIDLLLLHIKLFEKTWGETKNFAIIKKFFKMYINNFRGASLLRQKLMATGNFEEVENLIRSEGVEEPGN
ncbi:MAG TPA: tRNA-dihydrouridine synthase [Patescibacteria group bacterium]|nr:tRNA-dihydrouridine synthase [Patescibacteria group bacterium]